jgi:hypothetical protein
MARPSSQHQLNQVDNSSLDLYKKTPAGGIQDNTLYLQFSTCKGSNLVVVALAKPCRVSRVELSWVFARASEVVSETGELLYLYLSL